MLTCGCITFVGLIKIAIKKISYKKSVQPRKVPTISAQVTESIRAIQSSEEGQDEFELQSHSRIINVAPIHLEEESVESLENINMIQPKIQQTKMLVTCQRFGDLFLFGLVWQYSSNQNQYNKGRFKVRAN